MHIPPVGLWLSVDPLHTVHNIPPVGSWVSVDALSTAVSHQLGRECKTIVCFQNDDFMVTSRMFWGECYRKATVMAPSEIEEQI